MKYIILQGDGMADYPLDVLGGKTPLEAARTPNMDWLARCGIYGIAHVIPEGFPPGSDVGNMSIMGYDPAVIIPAAHLWKPRVWAFRSGPMISRFAVIS